MNEIYSKCLFLDTGHGKINPNTGRYVTSPSKEFKHSKGKFHKDSWFYEGVKNKEYGDLLTKKLIDRGVTVVPVSHTWKDTSLNDRANIANFYHQTIQEGIFLSLHSNATRNHNARGFSVWTSPGYTSSDPLATKLIEDYTNTFLDKEINTLGLRKLTQSYRDGDPDYEARLAALVQTIMPAILVENLFFDHYKDAKILMSDWYKEAYTDMLCNWVIWSLKQ